MIEQRLPALLCGLALLWSTAGCSLLPTRHADPTTELPSVYQNLPGQTETALLPDSWWQIFADPILDQLMAELFGQNLDLVQGVARYRQAEAQLKSTSSGLWPALNAEAALSRDRQPSMVDSVTGTNYHYSLAASYEIDLWNKIGSRSDAARYDLATAGDNLKTLYLSLSAQLAELYFLAREQRAQIALTDATIASFQDTLTRVEWRYQQGLVPALDLYQARQNLASAKAQRPQFEATLAKTEHALAVLLGRFPGEALSGSSSVLPDPPDPFQVGLPADLLTRRPDIQAALHRLQASDARVTAAMADRLPAINLLASVGRSRSEMSTLPIEGSFYSLAGSLLQPIFDAGRRRAEVERNEAVWQENLAAFQKTLLQSVQEVEDALVANQTTNARIQLLQERVAATSASLRLSEERYLKGLSDYLPVLTAQGLDFSAQSNLLAARRQLLTDRISLVRALGGDWMNQAVEHRLEQ